MIRTLLTAALAVVVVALGPLLLAGSSVAAPLGCDPVNAPEFCHTELASDAEFCDFDAPTRLWGHGQLLEDEAPYTGACGGELLTYSGEGVATYDDGTATNGRVWYWADEDLTVCRYEAGAWVSAATPTYGEPCTFGQAQA